MSDTTVLLLFQLLVYLRHPLLVYRFRRRLGHFPNVAAPATYNEKLLWRKVFDHNRQFVVFSDKLSAKRFMRTVCPDLPVPETLWVGEHPREIPADLLRRNVVVKTNHGCGFNYVVANGDADKAHMCRAVARWLKKVHGWKNGEWSYRYVRPSVFVEEKLTLGGSGLPTDLKLHVCRGRIVHAWAIDKPTGRAATLNAAGECIESTAVRYSAEDAILPVHPPLRVAFARAAEYAVRLGKDIDYARIDFLLTREQVWGGEITIYPAAGYDRWTSPDVARNLTRAWDIRDSAFLQRRQRGLLKRYARALGEHVERERGSRDGD